MKKIRQAIERVILAVFVSVTAFQPDPLFAGGQPSQGILIYQPASAAQSFRRPQVRDYCGPENNRGVSSAIPDELFGPFRGSCQRHDVCYYDGAKEIVSRMESKYSMSLFRADNSMKFEFGNQISGLKLACDAQFLLSLSQSCARVNLLKLYSCQAASVAYFSVVILFAKSVFRNAIDSVLVYR